MTLQSLYNGPTPNPASSDHWAARRRLAQIMRQLNLEAATTAADSEQLNQLCDQLEAVQQQLQQQPHLCGRNAYVDHGEFGDHRVLGYEINSLGGQANPLAPPVRIWFGDEMAHGSVFCNWAYEGPPGCLHGGYIAAIFDQFLGVAQAMTNQPGVTGRLTTRFHKPTPLNQELRLEARVAEVEGRKNVIQGTMWAGEIMTASCEGLFIYLPPEQFRNLADQSE